MPTITEDQLDEAFRFAQAFPEDAQVQEKATRIREAYLTQEAQGQQALRAMYQDRDRHGWNDDTYNRVSSALSDRPDGKFEVINEKFFADTYGLSSDQVRTMQKDLLEAYSTKTWGEPVTDDRAFYDRMGEEMDREDEVFSKGQQLALDGASGFEADAAFDFEYGADPKLKARADTLREQFRKAYDTTKNDLSSTGVSVDEFVEELQVSMGVKEEKGREPLPDSWFIENVLNMAPDKRDVFLSAVAARSGEGEEKSLLRASLEGLGRQATTMVRSMDNFERINLLSTLRDSVASGRIGADDIPEEYGFDPKKPIAKAFNPAKGFEALKSAPKQGTPEFAALSDDQKTALARIDKELEYITLYEKVNALAEGRIDPAKGSNWYTSGVIGASKMVPNIAVMAGGPIGAILNIQSYAGQRTTDFLIENPGADPTDATRIGLATGVAQGLLDLIPTKIIQGKIPFFSSWLEKATLKSAGLFGRAAVRIGAGTVFEVGQEFSQEVLAPGVVDEIAQVLKKDLPGANWDKRLEAFKSPETLSELIPSIVMLSLIGTGVGSIKDYRGGWMLASSRRLLIGAGIDPESADSIVAAAKQQDATTTQTLLRDALAKVDAGPVAEVLPAAQRAAFASLAQEIEDKRTAVFRLEKSGVIPQIVPTKDGFEVVNPQGVKRTFTTREEAQTARWEYVAEQEIEVHEDLARVIDRLDRGIRPDQRKDRELDPETKTLLDAKREGQRTDEGAKARADKAVFLDDQGAPTQQQAPADAETDLDIDAEHQQAVDAAILSSLDEDDRLAGMLIVGESSTEYRDRVYRTTVKLRNRATWATVIEEDSEGDAATMIQKGKRDWLADKLFAFDSDFQQGRVVNGKKLSLFEDGVTRETATDEDLIEAYSHLAQYYFVGTMKKGRQDGFKASEGFRSRYASAVRAGLSPIFDPLARLYRSIALRSTRLEKMRREGRLDTDLERELARSVGMTEQIEYEQQVNEEAGTIREEIDPDGVLEDPPKEKTFSVLAAVELAKEKRIDAITSEDEFFETFWPELLKKVGANYKPSTRNLGKVISVAVSDIQQWLNANPHYLDYYNTDWNLTNELLKDSFPDFSEGDFRFFRFLTGITSPSTPLDGNLVDAVGLLNEFKAEGNFARFVMDVKVNDGKEGNRYVKSGPFKLRANTGATKIFAAKVYEQILTENNGDHGKAIDFLEAMVPVSELHAFNKRFFKGGVGSIGNIKQVVKEATGQDKLIPRMFIFGPKVGAYTLNTLGNHEYTTTDIWEGRFIRSYFPQMFADATGLPVNRGEHEIFQRFASAFNKEMEDRFGLNLEPSAYQAARWFFMIAKAKEAGYRYARTDQPISEYARRAINRVLGLSIELPDGSGESGVDAGRGGESTFSVLAGGQRPESTGDGRGRASSGRTEAGAVSPLDGAPRVDGATGPDPGLVDVARDYAKSIGIPYGRQQTYAVVDEDRAARIAQAYDEMEHAPGDPVVAEAFENLIKQTTDQYRALEGAGYRFWFINPDNHGGYADSPYNAMRDIRTTKSMGVFPTAEGFGSGATEVDVSDNPLKAETGIQWPFGSPDGPLMPVLANDLFRAVHDAFGHGLEGAGFRARGEENAWQAHVKLFTGSAVGAITSETRGQNSWLNYGPYGEKNRTAKVENTTFADQKTGLMPEWTWTEGRVEHDVESTFSVLSNEIPINRMRRLMQQIDAMYSTGRTEGVENLEAELETLLEKADSDLDGMDESDDSEQITVPFSGAPIRSMDEEEDSTTPESELISLWYEWNGNQSSSRGSVDELRENYKTFGEFVRKNSGGEYGDWRVGEGITDEQIEVAAKESVANYERRRTAMLRRRVEKATFSVLNNAESRIADSFNPYFRSPDKRRKILLEAQFRSREKARDFQDIILAGRTVADLDQEQATREKATYGDLLVQYFGADTKEKIAALPTLDRKAARSEAKRQAQQWRTMQDRQQKTLPRETLIAAMRTLDAMIIALPTEIRGKIGGMVRLATLTQPGAMVAELERRAKRLDDVLEDYLSKEADKQVKKLFKLARPAKDESGKAKKGKAGADIHDLFTMARRSWKTMSSTDAEAYAQGLEAAVASGNLTPEEEAHKLLEAELVRSFGGWNDRYADSGKKDKNGRPIMTKVEDGADAVRKNHALDTATYIWQAGYLAYQQKKAAEKQQRDLMRAELRIATGKSGARPERVKAEEAGLKWKGAAKEKFFSILNFEQLVTWIFGPSPSAQWFIEQQRTAENKKIDAVQDVVDGVEDLFTKLAGGRFEGEKLQYRMMQRSIKAKSATGSIEPLSEMEAISALLMWMQEDGKRHMMGLRDDTGKLTTGWSYDQNFIDEISKQMTTEGWKVLSYLIAEYRKEYDTLNPIYREIYGINMPRNANYSPLTVKPGQAKQGQTIDPTTGSTVSSGSFTPGSLRTRAQVSAEPDFRDAISTFLSHKKQIEHWKAHAVFIRDAQGVLGNRELGNSVEASSGPEAVLLLRKWLDVLAQGGARDAATGTALMRLFDRMTGRAASMALVGRAGTVMIQATQLGAASAAMPTGAYLARLSRLMTGNLGWSKALNSEYIQRRLKSAPVAVRLAMDGLRSGSPTRTKHAVREIGKILSGADALFTAGTFAIVHDYTKSQAMKAGMSESDADTFALQEAERITENLAQPTRMGTRSYFEVTTTNPIFKLSWSFGSDARKNFALLGYTMAKGTPAEKARALLFVVGVNGILSGLIRNIWRDMRDDEDEEVFDAKYWSLRRLALAASTDWLFGFPIVGEEIQGAIYSALGEQRLDSGLFSAISQAPGAFKNLVIDWDSEDVLRDVEKIVMAAGLFNDQIAAGASVLHILRDVFDLSSNIIPD